MTTLVASARKVAAATINVLVTGETGTGKEVVARVIHGSSPRADRPFVPFNCTAVPKDLADSQLFGHRKGAFTGATADHPASSAPRPAARSTSTRSATSASTCSRSSSASSSRARSSRSASRARSASTCASSPPPTANLEQMVADGRFREDLFYRLNVVPLHVPPLRERREEVPPLAEHFLRRAAREFGKEGLHLAEETMEYLVLYRWPGNVRQLANEMRRLAAMTEPGAVLMPEHLDPAITAGRRTVVVDRASLAPTELVVRLDQPHAALIEHAERAQIRYALPQCGGRVEDAAPPARPLAKGALPQAPAARARIARRIGARIARIMLHRWRLLVRAAWPVIFLVALAGCASSGANRAPAAAPDEPSGPPVVLERPPVLVVEAIVTDKKGAPVTTLRVSDFQVSVDGRRRPGAAVARLYRGPGAAALAASVTSTAPGETQPVAEPSRTIVLVIDQPSFGPGDETRARTIVEAWLAAVGVADQVAVVAAAAARGRHDRLRARGRFARRSPPSGRSGPPAPRRCRSRPPIPRWPARTPGRPPAEGAGRPAQTAQRRTRARARTRRTKRRRRRRRPRPTPASVSPAVLKAHAVSSLGGLSAVLRSLATVPGGKTILFVSAGLVATNARAEAAAVARRRRPRAGADLRPAGAHRRRILPRRGRAGTCATSRRTPAARWCRSRASPRRRSSGWPASSRSRTS